MNHRVPCDRCEGTGNEPRACGWVDGSVCACEAYRCQECGGRGWVVCEADDCETCVEAVEATARGLVEAARGASNG